MPSVPSSDEPDIQPDSEVSDDWKQQPGEPALKVVTQGGAIVVQSLAVGQTAALVLRPAVALWLAEQLTYQANLVKSGIILPGPGGSIPPLTGPNGGGPQK